MLTFGTTYMGDSPQSLSLYQIGDFYITANFWCEMFSIFSQKTIPILTETSHISLHLYEGDSKIFNVAELTGMHETNSVSQCSILN